MVTTTSSRNTADSVETMATCGSVIEETELQIATHGQYSITEEYVEFR